MPLIYFSRNYGRKKKETLRQIALLISQREEITTESAEYVQRCTGEYDLVFLPQYQCFELFVNEDGQGITNLRSYKNKFLETLLNKQNLNMNKKGG